MDENTVAGLALAVERAIRGFRSVVSFREGEIRIGLKRRYFLPILWYMTQVDGVADPASTVQFMGAEIYCVDD